MTQLNKSFIIIFIILLSVSLMSLTYLIFHSYMTNFDYMVLKSFYQLRNTMLDNFFLAITWLGSLWILLPLSIAILIFLPNKFKHFKIVFIVGFSITIVITHIMKNIFERQRPDFFDALVDMPLDFSFPSAHTAQITAFTFLVWILFLRTRFNGILLNSILIFIAINVAVSRIYLQVHFPTDVIAGFLVAIVCCFITLLTIKSKQELYYEK